MSYSSVGESRENRSVSFVDGENAKGGQDVRNESTKLVRSAVKREGDVGDERRPRNDLGESDLKALKAMSAVETYED